MYRASTLILLMAVSCGSPQEIWYQELTPAGKADAITSLLGSDIPSALVNPQAHYLPNRSIYSLYAAGAFDDTSLEVAERADGIIANHPADGRLDVAELVRMEQPPFYDSLFPAEKAALLGLWTRMEAAEGSMLMDALEPRSLEVSDVSTDPSGGLMAPEHIDITTLPVSLQQTAQRLQLMFDSDSDGSTVTMADVLDGLAVSQVFTPAEVGYLNQLAEQFELQAESVADARLVVAAPGAQEVKGVLGPVIFRLRSVMRYADERAFMHYGSGAHEWVGSLTGTLTESATATLPDSARALLVNLGTGEEFSFEEGEVPADLVAGIYNLEVWQDNARVFSTNATLPDMSGKLSELDLNEYLDYTLEAEDGTVLKRNLVDTAREYYTALTFRSTHTYDMSWDWTRPDVHPEYARETSTPKVSLPPGRYTRTADTVGPVTLDIYPGGVAWATWDGLTHRMGFATVPGATATAKVFYAARNGVEVTFDPYKETLHVFRRHAESNRTALDEVLTAAMREQ